MEIHEAFAKFGARCAFKNPSSTTVGSRQGRRGCSAAEPAMELAGRRLRGGLRSWHALRGRGFRGTCPRRVSRASHRRPRWRWAHRGEGAGHSDAYHGHGALGAAAAGTHPVRRCRRQRQSERRPGPRRATNSHRTHTTGERYRDARSKGGGRAASCTMANTEGVHACALRFADRAGGVHQLDGPQYLDEGWRGGPPRRLAAVAWRCLACPGGSPKAADPAACPVHTDGAAERLQALRPGQ